MIAELKNIIRWKNPFQNPRKRAFLINKISGKFVYKHLGTREYVKN